MTSEAGRWRVGMDTGGTFTDLIAVDADGHVRVSKVSSTPSRPAVAVFEAVRGVHLNLGADLESFVLGTTIATNAVIMRSGARVIVLTTAGFEDVLEIQRIDRPPIYDLQWVKTPAFARRRDTHGVVERIGADGVVRQELLDTEVGRVVEAISDEYHRDPKIAVAISLLFSYINPSHERRLATALRSALPYLPLSVSHEVAPVWREYERTCTTVLDAYVHGIVEEFVADLAGQVDGVTLPPRAGLMKSNGGQVPLAHAAQRPIELVLSGLAGGMIAGAYWAQEVGSPKAVSLDMGGTSADVGVINDGHLQFSGLFEPEWGIPVTIPVIDVTTIGAGGSSIARVDAGGLLNVGPESAGADPGPACYLRGGVRPTVTDANVVLGRLDPAYFLGGQLPLDSAAARRATEEIATQLNVQLDEAAEAIVSVAVENMAGAVRLVTVDRGYDYREFDLIAFGGAGPLHAVDIARRLGMRRVIIPPTPGLVSAFGSVIADERIDRRVTLVQRLNEEGSSRVMQAVTDLAQTTASELRSQAQGDTSNLEVQSYVACRYVGQNYEQEIKTYSGHVDKSFELAIPLSRDGLGERSIEDDFHEVHERAYGYSMRDQPVETVYIGASAVIPTPRVSLTPYDLEEPTPDVYRWVADGKNGRVETRVVRREEIAPGTRLSGPAIVSEGNSTTFVPSGFEVVVHETYCLLIQAKGEISA